MDKKSIMEKFSSLRVLDQDILDLIEDRSCRIDDLINLQKIREIQRMRADIKKYSNELRISNKK